MKKPNKRRIALLIFLSLLICASGLQASEVNLQAAPTSMKKVVGVVTDISEFPVPGATILEIGTNNATMTDIDGKFTIEVNPDATLSISYIGYNTQKIKITNKLNLEIKLTDDISMLDEIIVVGYNTVSKSQMTGSIAKVKGEDMAFATSPTLESRLQGKVPGLMILSGSGQPGSDNLQIRIRGSGSINGSNTPLYIMDGIMVEPGQFAALNPNDIADLQVLKDASATAIYGSRGANGVITITTKSGGSKNGKTVFNYRAQFGVSKMRDYVDMMSSEENILYQSILVGQKPTSTQFPLMSYLKQEKDGTISDDGKALLVRARANDTDWIGEMSQTGFLMDHSFSVSGGKEKTRFFLSASYLDQEGVLKKSAMDRISVRLNLDHTVNKYISFGVKLSGGYSNVNFSDPESGQGRNGWTNPWFTALLAYPYENPTDWNNKDNPTLLTKYFDSKLGKLKIVGAAFVKADITDWLSVRSNFGMDYMNNKLFKTIDRNHPAVASVKGSMDQMVNYFNRYTWTNTVNVNKVFNGVHTLNAVAGFELFNGEYYSFNQTGYDINQALSESPAGIGDKTGSSNNRPSIGGSKTRNNLLSFFTQASYSYDNRYSISASLRHDTSSRFADGNKSALFYSVGASWNIRNESFMDGVDWLDILKLRASHGTTGNQDGISNFGTFDGYSNVSYGGNSGYIHSQIGNPDLRWETSAQTNIGVDASFFESRLNVTLDAYYIKTKDLYMHKSLSKTSGFGSILVNAGSVSNQGVELSVQANIIDKPDFKWNLGANFTYNKNTVLDLGTWKNAEGKFQNGDLIYEEGKSLGTWSMYEWAGVNPQTGDVEFYKEDGTTTPKESEAVKVDKFGSFEIPYFGGFNTSFSYKTISLDIAFTYAFDYTIMNASRWYLNNHNFNGNKPTYMLDLWQKPGDETDVPRLDSPYNVSPWASQFLEDASYLRLKTLRLNYSFPQRWMKKILISSLSLYAQAENVWTLTEYTGADPEVNGSVDYMSYPKPFTVSLGIDINF